MPAEKGFDPVPEAPEDQAEEKNRGGIIPPFPTEPVDRVPLGIMAPEESEQDGQQDSQAQQGQGGVPAADERKEEPEQGVEEGDLDDEPSVAIRPARISSRLVIQKGIRTEGKRLAGKVFR